MNQQYKQKTKKIMVKNKEPITIKVKTINLETMLLLKKNYQELILKNQKEITTPM